MSFLSLLLYIPLQIVFLPFAILGAMLVAYKQIVVSKRLGISQTAIEVINGRWAMHIFGMRNDPATAGLAAGLPNTSLFGLWLCLFPLWLKHKISGNYFIYPRIPAPGSETLYDLIVTRTLCFDRIIERTIGQVEQFVIMGAGYDMRAYGDLHRTGVTFFELDQANVQQHKLAQLEHTGIPSEHVRFVTVDFGNEDIFENLMQSGFDATRKTLFLWEGVTLYLSEAEVRGTIRNIRRQAAVGSILLTDIYADYLVKKYKTGSGKKVLDYTGEGLDFGLNLSVDYEEELLKFVQSESMSAGETFFLGWKNKKGPFVVVIEMKCE